MKRVHPYVSLHNFTHTVMRYVQFYMLSVQEVKECLRVFRASRTCEIPFHRRHACLEYMHDLARSPRPRVMTNRDFCNL